MDVLADGIKDLTLWYMLFADDIVMCGTRRWEIKKKVEERRRVADDIEAEDQ